MRRVLEAVMARVTVVHALPGRLRLHVPAIAHLPDDAPVGEYACAAIASVRGIRSVRVSRATATLLIEYGDPATESRIISLARSVVELLIANADRFAALEPDQRRRLDARLRRYLAGIVLDPADEVVLPDEVWHER